MLVVVAVIALGGCSDDDRDRQVADTPTSAGPTTTSPTEAGLVGTGSCRDEHDGGLWMVEMVVDHSYGELVVTWKTSGPFFDATERILYTVMLSNYGPDGSGPSYQLGVSTDELGRGMSAFVLDQVTGESYELGAAPDYEVGGVIGRFPLASIVDLGNGFDWSAAVAVDGIDIDGCPVLPSEAEQEQVERTVPFPFGARPEDRYHPTEGDLS